MELAKKGFIGMCCHGGFHIEWGHLKPNCLNLSRCMEGLPFYFEREMGSVRNMVRYPGLFMTHLLYEIPVPSVQFGHQERLLHLFSLDTVKGSGPLTAFWSIVTSRNTGAIFLGTK